MSNKVKVTINKRGRIPGVGLGPFRRPIIISESLAERLKGMGYPVTVYEKVNSNTSIQKNLINNNKTSMVNENKPAEEKIVNEVVEETETQNQVNVEEDEVILTSPVIVEDVADVEETEEEELVESTEIDDEDIEEILVDDNDLSAEAYYTEEFLKTKAVCKKILANRKVQHDSNATLPMLRKLVLTSNPEVEIIEEN